MQAASIRSTPLFSDAVNNVFGGYSEKYFQSREKLTKQQVSRRLRRWFWQNADGTACLQLLYGNVPLRLQGNDTTIEVRTLADLPSANDLVIEAIEAGELDQALLDALETREQKLRGIKNCC